MSEQVQIKLRTTQDLKSRIHRVTELTGRSVNSEINWLLERALTGRYIPEEKITAAEARNRALNARTDMLARLKEEAFEAIHASIEFGRTDAHLFLDSLTLESKEDPVVHSTVQPLIDYLESLGYEITEWDTDSMKIEF